MTGYPAFCATCYLLTHDGRPCDTDALERRRRLAGLRIAKDRLSALGYEEIRRENFLRAAKLFSASARTALSMSALLAEEANAIRGRES